MGRLPAGGEGRGRWSGLRLGTSHGATVLLLAVMASYLVFHRLALPQSVGSAWLHDNGWVSWYTLALIALSLGLIVASIPRASFARERATLLALSYIALIYLLREADFHRLFTDEHVTRLSFYTDEDIALGQRLVAALIMGPFFVLLLGMALRYARPVLRAAREGRPWAVSLILWGSTLLTSQLADQLLRHRYTGKVIEEGLEATAAGLALLTVAHMRAAPEWVLPYTREPTRQL